MLEVGSDLEILRQKFLRIKSRASGMKIAPDPLLAFRRMVPYDEDFKPEMESFSLDPELDVRAVWERFYQEARGLCEEFEKQLQQAADRDKEDLLGWFKGYLCEGVVPMHVNRAQAFVRV